MIPTRSASWFTTAFFFLGLKGNDLEALETALPRDDLVVKAGFSDSSKLIFFFERHFVTLCLFRLFLCAFFSELIPISLSFNLSACFLALSFSRISSRFCLFCLVRSLYSLIRVLGDLGFAIP